MNYQLLLMQDTNLSIAPNMPYFLFSFNLGLQCSLLSKMNQHESFVSNTECLWIVIHYNLYKDFPNNMLLFNILPAVRISSGCVAESEEPVVNERQQQAPLATVKTT